MFCTDDDLYHHLVYSKTVNYNRCLVPADLKLNCHKGWYSLNRIEVIMDLLKMPFFITNKIVKLFYSTVFPVSTAMFHVDLHASNFAWKEYDWPVIKTHSSVSAAKKTKKTCSTQVCYLLVP